MCYVAHEINKTPTHVVTMRERGSKYRYVMLIASTLMAMITVGGLNSFSILYKELLDFYDTRAGDTAIISSLCIFLNFAIGR